MRGEIVQIWRYPVKSMAGESLQQSEIGALGLAGDRGWAVRDEKRGGIRGAKKIPALMRCSARYPEPPGPDPLVLPVPEIELPDGARLRADAEDAAERLSTAVENPVTLWPRRPASDREHYRRGAPDHEDFERELRSIFGREPDEPLPDLGAFPPDILEYESPPGTYFDAYPVLVVTDASLRRLQALAPDSRVDVRRFRPNLVVALDEEAGDAGFPEAAWGGRRLRVGDATLELTIPCPRCVMITHAFDDLPRDPGLMRTVVREADQCLGIYAQVATPGTVRVGDPVALEP
jgi:uncharacterized protein YcbX